MTVNLMHFRSHTTFSMSMHT